MQQPTLNLSSTEDFPALGASKALRKTLSVPQKMDGKTGTLVKPRRNTHVPLLPADLVKLGDWIEGKTPRTEKVAVDAIGHRQGWALWLDADNTALFSVLYKDGQVLCIQRKCSISCSTCCGDATEARIFKDGAFLRVVKRKCPSSYCRRLAEMTPKERAATIAYYHFLDNYERPSPEWWREGSELVC